MLTIFITGLGMCKKLRTYLMPNLSIMD